MFDSSHESCAAGTARTIDATGAVETADFSPVPTANRSNPLSSAAPLQIAELLGSGRHGLVVRAYRATEAGRTEVAVKIPSGSRSLAAEAAALRRFAHRHVIAVVDGPLSNGSLLLEYCDEGTLAQKAANKRLCADEISTVLDTIVSALRPIHEAGWIHGDISPANIGLRSHEGPALLDFATAHLADGSSVDEGTAEFAGPFRQADQQLDIRSLAATMLACLDSSAVETVARFEELVRRCDSGVDVSLDDLLTSDAGWVAVSSLEPSDTPSPTENPPTTLDPAAKQLGPPDTPITREYGPRPDDEDPPAPKDRDPRPWLSPLSVLLGLSIVTVLICSEFRLLPTRDDTEPEAGYLQQFETAEETLTNAGVHWDPSTGMVEVFQPNGTPQRFLAGQPGDLAAVADWTCDGITTLGVYRPTTKNWFVFDSWETNATSTVAVLSAEGDRIDTNLFVEQDPFGCAAPAVR